MYLQSNPAISNSVNSKSPLFRRKSEFPWIFPSPLSFPGYFETPLFRTFVHFPWDFEIAGFDCILFLKHFKVVTSLKSGDNFSQRLGPKWRRECLPFVTVLYLAAEKSDCLKLYLDLCSIKMSLI